MLKFGHELLAGRNWEARLPIQLVEAHMTLAGQAENTTDYYKNESVWKDIRSVYVGYLNLYPDASWDRTWYAKLACLCGQWDVAKAQFEKLGDKVQLRAFKDPAELDRLKTEAAAKGK
jgi:hypothetical protein